MSAEKRAKHREMNKRIESWTNPDNSNSAEFTGYAGSELKAMFREEFSDEYLKFLIKKTDGNDIAELLFMAFCRGVNAA